MSPGIRRPYVYVAAITVAAHLGILGAGFVYDDAPIVVENPLVASLDQAGAWFTSGYWPGHDLYYRPLVVAGYALERALFGVDPTAAHIVSLAWHVLASCLVAALATRLAPPAAGERQARITGLIAGTLFGVHPLLTEPVYWVSARSDLLGTVAVLAALLVGRNVTLPGAARAALVGAIALCGLLCKEIVAALPLLLILDAAWRARHDARSPGLRTAVPALAGVIVALALYGVLRAIAFDGQLTGDAASANGASVLHNPLTAAGSSERALTPLAIVAIVAGHVIWPRGLSSDYALDSIPLAGSVADPRVLAGTLVVVLAAIAAVVSLRRRGVLAWAIGFGVVTWLPASNTLVLGGALFGERFVYLPAIGLAIAAGALGTRLHERLTGGARRAAGVLFLAVVAACVYQDHVRAGDWHSNDTLYGSVVRARPSNAQGHYNLGALALDAAAARPAGNPDRRSRLDEAESHFARAVEIFPGYLLAQMNVGVTRAERGDWTGALSAFEAAAEIEPRDPRVQFNLGLAHERLGARDVAVRHYRESAALVPGGGPAAAALRRLLAPRPSRP